MKKTKKMLALSMAAAMVLSACGQSGTQEQTGATEAPKQETVTQAASQTAAQAAPAETEPAKKTWTDDDSKEITIVMVRSAAPGEKNLIEEELEKRTNTKINLVLVNSTDYANKLSTMLASGDVPDIFEVTSLGDQQDYVDAGILADMKDVLNAVAPNVLNETKDYIYNVPVNRDGGIYIVPSAAKDYSSNINMRTDWLENLGMELPTNLDEYRAVLNAFTYNDPDQDGQDDTLGLTFILNHFPGASGKAFASVFGAYGIPARTNATIELEDGTVTVWQKHPRFMEAMNYIRTLLADGVCEPEYVSMPAMTSYEKLWTGIAGCIEFQCVGPTNNWYPGRYTEDLAPTFGFPILEGPYGDKGVPAVYQDLAKGFAFAADCENLEGAARIANYCMSDEGSELMTFGIEGVMWQWVDEANGVMEYLGEYKDSAVHRGTGAYCASNLFAPTNNAEKRTLNALTREGIKMQEEYAIDWAYVPYVSEVRRESGADMDQILKEMVAELLATNDDPQKVYDRYIAEWEMNGGSDWEAEITAEWNKIK